MGEVFRITQELRSGFARLESKLDPLVVLPTMLEAHTEEDRRRFDNLEQSKTWLIRVIGAAAITGLLGLLFTLVKL